MYVLEVFWWDCLLRQRFPCVFGGAGCVHAWLLLIFCWTLMTIDRLNRWIRFAGLILLCVKHCHIAATASRGCQELDLFAVTDLIWIWYICLYKCFDLLWYICLYKTIQINTFECFYPKEISATLIPSGISHQKRDVFVLRSFTPPFSQTGLTWVYCFT